MHTGLNVQFGVDQAFEHLARQQAHVFGKKAKQGLGQKMGDLFGVVFLGGAGLWAAFAQVVGQSGKAFGGFFGDVAGGFFGTKALRVSPHAAQFLLHGRVGELG